MASRVHGERPVKQKRMPSRDADRNFIAVEGINYYIRLKNGKPISLVKEENFRFKHILGLDIQRFDEQVYLCSLTASEKLSTSIGWFQKKYKKHTRDFTAVQITAIKHARKECGAGLAKLADVYQTTPKVIQDITHLGRSNKHA